VIPELYLLRSIHISIGAPDAKEFEGWSSDGLDFALVHSDDTWHAIMQV
jgi:hypothetical protein